MSLDCSPLRCFCLLGLVLLPSGCVSRRVEYDPGYLSGGTPGTGSVAGKALLVAGPEIYNYTYTGRPKSFHGGGTSLQLPLGRIVCETAQDTMRSLFTGGCDRASSIGSDGDYAAIIQVRPLAYEYAFNQIRNLTMAITPQVRLSIEVALMDGSRSQYFSQVYDSGTVNDTTTLDTLRPAETINRHTHRIVQNLLSQAAADVRRTITARSTSAAIAPPSPAATPPHPGAKQPAPAQESVRERLAKLKQLHADGLISKEAYEKKQGEILDSY